MTKTVFIKAPLPEVYSKAFQWLSLQDYEIVEQVKEQKIVVRPPNYTGSRVVGSLGLLLGVVPGLCVLLYSVWTLTITFVGETDGVFVTGKTQSSASRPLKIMRELAGILSFLS
jgi:proteasome assembly chaperone (PAC2) family protein